MTALTTDEILKPDIEAPTKKCHWWSEQLHCWHALDKSYTHMIFRRCCWCSRNEFSELVATGHGKHLPNKKDQTLIWTEWAKWYDKWYD